MNSTGRGSRGLGFTLIELAIALAILGVLGALSLNQYLAYIERVRVARAVIEMKDITAQLDPISFDGGKLPASLAAIGLGGRKDPWGRAYVYLKIRGNPASFVKSRKDQFLVPLNTDYDLYSRGKNGLSQPKISDKVSLDDVVRANDGAFLGLAAKY